MKYSFTLFALLASVLARPEANEASLKARSHPRDVRALQGAFVRPRWNPELGRREVPQEHSHEKFITSVRTSLNLNNPDQIVDPVFGLLGNGAAKQGLGKLTDTECLQQATADQAFTNAKAAGDIAGMTSALVFRALERNTGQVGLASNSCTSVTAINPEIAALSQHQDPASTNAAATNKKITLDLAVQIASIGGDSSIALQSGTFAPGKIGDPTAKGNTCDVQNDPVGCIFTQNLLVEDATIDEINSAVAAAGGSAAPTAAAPTVAASSSVASASLSSSVPVQTQVISTMMMTMTQVATECASAVAPPAGMTAITMPTQDASSVINIALSLGISINIGNGNSGPSAVVTDSGAATQTNVQVQSPTITNVAAASTSVDCSGPISSALASLAGASALNGTSAATAPAFSNATATAVVSSPSATIVPSTSSLDLGSCKNPTIIFANNLDGRNEPSFAPADETTFTHGSALGIKVITDFICQQLGVKCNASAATINACNQGATAAQGATGQAAADAFNAALGF